MLSLEQTLNYAYPKLYNVNDKEIILPLKKTSFNEIGFYVLNASSNVLIISNKGNVNLLQKLKQEIKNKVSKYPFHTIVRTVHLGVQNNNSMIMNQRDENYLGKLDLETFLYDDLSGSESYVNFLSLIKTKMEVLERED